MWTPPSLTNTFQRRSAFDALAALGGVWAALQLYKVASFGYLHFLRRSRLARYKQVTKGSSDSQTWALVTGASDGIGKGFAEELCEQGFNVILHGRNEKKLEGVKASLLARWPERQIELLIIDAVSAVNDTTTFQAAADRFSQYNIRVLINNVAGAPEPLWTPLQDRTATEVTKCIAATADFPVQLTLALLPQLIKRQPALIINIGSGVGCLPAPYISVYAGAKGYNHAWSRCISTEMKAEGHDIEVLGILVGMVSTGAAQRDTSLMVPSARRFAQSCLHMVGCGHSLVWAYWPHAVQFGGLMMNLPDIFMERAIIGIARSEKAIEEAKAKGKQ